MPPKRGAAKQEDEEQRKAEEEAAKQAAKGLREIMAGEAAAGVDPAMAMLMFMQRKMQKQDERMQMQQDQMQMLARTLADLGGGGAGAGLHGGGGHGGGGAAATRSRKMEAPRLKSPEEATLSIFRDLKERFMEYAAITKLDTECDRRTRRGVLREAIHEDWSRLWSTGVLEVDDAHNWREIVELMSEYLRDRRSPLLDRLNIHDRSQVRSPLRSTTPTSRFFTIPAGSTST